MVGRYTGDPAKVGCESKSRYCSTTHKDRSENLPGKGDDICALSSSDDVLALWLYAEAVVRLSALR